VCLDVTSDGHGVTNVKTESIVDCQPEAQAEVTVTVTGGAIPIQSDLSFSYTYTNSALQGSSIKGTFDTAGDVTGTLEIHASFDDNGTHYDCSSVAYGFHAKLGG